ncbi:LruC domain-containing protein [Pedobacter sp. SYP-B3415]|uniref:LruC domain-containing protein n=1 Tax=Pedobacter sp. SYP-B3415 TaxID=2496641 RepID=UPI00101C2E22|nr:LruC domain-containing protein [Pedobacter sp. SYP-B3415]
MKNFKILPGLLLAFFALVSACKKDSGPEAEPEETGNGIPASFSYLTTNQVNVSIQLLSNNNQPIAGAVVTVVAAGSPEKTFLKGVSDGAGFIKGIINVPSYLDTIAVLPKYTGLLDEVRSVVKGKSSVNIVVGGANGLSGDVVLSASASPRAGLQKIGNGPSTQGIFGTDYVYPSPYNTAGDAIVNTSEYPFSLGRPKYLTAASDVVNANLLSYINASLPEGLPLTQTHPEYLTSTAQSNIVITQNDTEVFITFVSEGASYRNSLAWYSYPTNNPPTAASGSSLTGAIDKVTYVFPNASAYGSSGGLRTGNKVSLGKFSAGTTIALVLIQDAWTNSNGVSYTNTKFYSDSRFNPESTTALRKHSVMLYDNQHSLFLFGFEDTNRTSSSDNDFNDLVVYASATPTAGISTTNVSLIDTRVDSDGDGVEDTLDEFPNDASRAYTSYYPSANTWGTLAFEDNWPNQGDYDVNDLVVNYRYKYVSNASNNVVEMTGDFQPIAAGADFKNGFGVQLPVAANAVSSVSGQSLQNGYITQAANGVEAGQARAVIIPFDSHENLLKNADGSPQVNTDPSKTKATGSIASVVVRFASPIASTALGTAPYNPFLISNRRRAYEIHLPNNVPTDKADKALFTTGADNSSVTSGRYYLDKNNSPWALNFADAFSYPAETKSISDTYLRFLDWAKSGGTTYLDWYVNAGAGYRNTGNIYR